MHRTHQTALETKHADIDRQIAEEAHRPHPDDLLLATLKKRKLRLKEEIGER